MTKSVGGAIVLCGPSLLACLLTAVPAHAQTAIEHVIHSFGNFSNGANPYGTPTRDSSGNLYGTTYQGGAANLAWCSNAAAPGIRCCTASRAGPTAPTPMQASHWTRRATCTDSTYQGGTANAGVVYKIDPSGQETVLYAFTGGDDGANPYAGVTLDSAGNLYGTTVNGGAASAGVVYRVTPAGLESVLLAFAGKGGGANPYGSVTFDAAGNLYGTTYKGGARGYGEIYKLSPSGAETLLYSFTRVQGGESQSGVILDAAGNLYGTVEYEVYKVDAAGTYTMLHRFDGEGP